MFSRFSNQIHELRQQYSNFLTSGLNLLFLFIGVRMETREGWLWSFSLIALTNFIAWFGNTRRYRLINDTPTSSIASAAQGYVEFSGDAKQYADYILASKLAGMPCVWYRYLIEQHTGDKRGWDVVERGVSDDTFLLTDQSGQCVIDPEMAEVMTSHKRVWLEDDCRYTEYLLLPKETLYALGEFTTVGGAASDLNLKQDVNAMLAEWKRDQPTLLKRFDLNRDGTFDTREWELARRDAVRQVQRQHREIKMKDGVSVLHKPGDGRLFILSNLDHEALSGKYRLWGWLHLLFFFAACTSLVFNLAVK